MKAIENFLKKQGKELKPNTLKDEAKKLTKNKAFSKLTAKEKDLLLETLCKMFNLI